MTDRGTVNKKAMAILRDRYRDEYQQIVDDLRGNVERPCTVCGTAHRRSADTCGPVCAKMWSTLRMHIGEARERQRAANAVVQVRHAKTPEQRANREAHAQRVAAGTVRYNGRWLLVASETYKVALDAARRGLPIVRELPEPIQRQLADALAAERAEAG